VAFDEHARDPEARRSLGQAFSLLQTSGGQRSGEGRRPLVPCSGRLKIPLAKQTLLVGLNQCILLSLAMVVLAGLVGAGGFGAEVTRGLTRMEMGLGLRAGLAIVAVALLLDRVSRGLFDRDRGPRAA